MTPRLLLATLGLGVFLGALDMNILALALPRLAVDFDIPEAATVWIVVAYSAAYLVAMPIVGRLGDLKGRRKAFLFGLATFTAGSALCALAGWVGHWLWLLLVGRVVQGLGAGGLVPVATAMIGAHVPEERRGKALGLIGMAFGGASILGPLLGGVLIDRVGWEWLFALNVPVGLAAVRLARANLPELWPTARGRVDVAGGVLLAIALAAFVVGAEGVATNLRELASPFSGAVPGLWGLAATAGWAFTMRERLAADPMLDLGLYRLGAVRTAFALAFLYGLGMIVAMVFTPLFFHYRFGLGSLGAGLALLPMAAAVGFASMKGGKLSDAWGPRLTLGLGLAVFALGLAGLWLGAATAPLVAVLGVLAVVGLGFGLCQAPLTHAVLAATPASVHGQVSGAVNTHRSLGGVVGATLGACFIADAMSRVGGRMLDALGGSLPPNCLIPRVIDPHHVDQMVQMLPESARGPAIATATRIVGEQMVSGLTALYAVGAGSLAIAFVLALALPKGRPAAEAPPAAPAEPAPEARAA